MISPSEVVPLVSAARAGDRSALDRLLSMHLAIAHSVALGTVRHWADAADVVQTAFVTAIEKLATCRDPARFTGWLLQIVRNTGIDAIRFRTRSVARHADVEPELAQIVTCEPDPLSRAAMRAGLVAALGTLTERQRQVVLLYDLEGWKHGEIADLLEISEVMSRQELFIARRGVRSALEPEFRSRSKP